MIFNVIQNRKCLKKFENEKLFPSWCILYEALCTMYHGTDIADGCAVAVFLKGRNKIIIHFEYEREDEKKSDLNQSVSILAVFLGRFESWCNYKWAKRYLQTNSVCKIRVLVFHRMQYPFVSCNKRNTPTLPTFDDVDEFQGRYST